MLSVHPRHKVLAARQSRQRARRSYGRRPRFESLESRRVLAPVINEIQMPAEFPQHNLDQYVEIRGEPGEVLASGTYLVAVDGLGNSGNVRAMFDLSNVKLGANGFLVLTQHEVDDSYNVHPDATELTGSDGFGGMKAPGDPDGTDRFSDNSLTGNTLAEFFLEPTTFLLIQSATPPTVGQDIDGDDNAIRDGDAAAWTILDSVAVVNFGIGSISYSPLIFAEHSAEIVAEAPFEIVRTHEVSWVGRSGDSVGSAPPAWIGAKAVEVSFLSSNYRLDNGFTVPGSFAGRHLEHVGASNFFATVSGQVFEDANGDGIKQETERGMFNVPVRVGFFTEDMVSIQANDFPPPNPPAVNPSLQNFFRSVTLTAADDGARQRSSDTHPIRVVDNPLTESANEFVFAHGANDTSFTADNALRIDFYEPAKAVALSTFATTDSHFAITLYDSRDEQLSAATKVVAAGHDFIAASLDTADAAYAVAYRLTGDGVINLISLNQSVPTATTDAHGNYRIPRVPPRIGAFNGEHFVVQTRPQGLKQTFPGSNAPHIITVADTAPKTGINFGNQHPNRPPVVEEQEFAAPENSPLGTVVGTVSASDPDFGQSLTYAITGGAGQEKFTIDSKTGQLTVATGAVLNFEGTNSYSLAVTVTDNATPPASATATITISLTNVDEPPTQILLSSNTISELADTSGQVIIGTLTTNDPDAGAAYTIVPHVDSPDLSAFEVLDLDNDERFETLALKAGQTLDFETKPTYELLLVALVTNPGDPVLIQPITIQVLDENEPASQVTLSSNTVSEVADTSQPVVIGALGTDDPDTNPNFSTYTYVLTPGAADNNSFMLIDHDSNGTADRLALQAGATLDHATKPTFSVQVEAIGPGGPPVVTNLTVQVLANQPPVILPNQSFSIDENSPIGAVVGTVIVTDPDDHSPGQGNPFSIFPQVLFSIDADGKILVASPLDHETTSSQLVQVIYTDPRGLSDTKTITIHVNDVVETMNELPVAKNFAESTGPGEPITFDVAAGATDADGTIDPLSAAIVTGPEDGTATVGVDGKITYTPAEGFHGFDDFTYTVRDNQGGVSNVATITIDVSEPVNLLWQRDETFREDVDGDGDVDISDLLAVVQFLRDNGLGFEFSTPPQAGDTLANVDGDDIASVNDLLIVVRALRDLQNAGQGEGETPPTEESFPPSVVASAEFVFIPNVEDDEEDAWEAVLAQLAADVACAPS